MRKLTSLLLTLLFCSPFYSFRTKPVVTSDTIYIRADGSVDPTTAPLTTVDNITYTFTGDFNGKLTVSRNNIIINGSGYELQGSHEQGYSGINVIGRVNITISHITVRDFEIAINLRNSFGMVLFKNTIIHNDLFGLDLTDSSNHTIYENTIIDSHHGITVQGSHNNTIYSNYFDNNFIVAISVIGYSSNNLVTYNTMANSTNYGVAIELDAYNNEISGNWILSNSIGIWSFNSYNNSIFHNNIINNSFSVFTTGTEYSNLWDNDCEGNFWSDYDTRYPNASYDEFGIGNVSYVIDANNTDHYPLRNLYWNPADTNHDLKVDIFDVVLVTSFYHTYWKPECCHIDVAEPYGIIDIFDIVKICMSYGEEYTP